MGHVKEGGCRIGQERICQDERSARLGTGQSRRPDPFRSREPVYIDDVQQILRDEGFIQSVSRRGNSQDNAPMESFFGRLKTHILSLIALCAEQETAEELVNNYLESHNDESYMYELAA